MCSETEGVVVEMLITLLFRLYRVYCDSKGFFQIVYKEKSKLFFRIIQKGEEKEKMKSKNIFATLLLFVFVASIITLIPLININVQAQTSPTPAPTPTPTLVTYPIVDAIPNPIGVGQVTLLKMGILQQLGSALWGWTVSMTVTKPDGTTQTLGPFYTDSTGSTYTQYTPDQVGTYIVTTIFPEQLCPVTFTSSESGATITKGTIMKASTATMNLTVQQEPLQFYPGHALPTEYWSRPIDPQLREWYSISGNWVTRPDNS